MRILVSQLVERKLTKLRDPDRFVERFPRVEVTQAYTGARMLLGVWRQPVPALRDRNAMADGGHRVLKRLVGTDVHADITGCDDGHPEFLGYTGHQLPMLFVLRAVMQGERDAGATGNALD